ncbi:hypothetical protein RO3G_06393 [Lichtheimia corymbifera JMRC:FSU:9682]|uniref:Uncharacterized protein n=1 Tax=Lichtheimia corymbifera JMRC:FSU:9682 TaxID=1263082 RepID=A0A068S1K3_9FUNG|nr:hypothetical protein RO3G_06393 [Lichtheimia corymbifera JMRC:FSU:9682]
MKINDLPPEILALIFQVLPSQYDLFQCALTCKHFNEGAIPLLWRAPDLSQNNQFSKFVRCLTSSRKPLGHWVRRFKVDVDTHSIGDHDCINLVQYMPQLEEFIVENAERLTDKSICKLPEQCQQLQELQLERADITYRSAHYLGRCKRLRRLTLRDCSKLNSLTLLPFAECPLEYLDLSGCKWLNAQDTAYDLRAFHRLKHLDIVCSDQGSMNEFMQHLTVDDETGQTIIPALTSFSVTGRNQIGDDAVVQFVQLHPHLEYLTLMACAITDISLNAIQHHLPQLRFLDISYCEGVSQGGVRKLIQHSEGLEMIGLKGCGITPFAELLSNLSSSPRRPLIDRLGQVELAIIRSAPEEHVPTSPQTTQQQQDDDPTPMDHELILPQNDTPDPTQEMHDHSIFLAYAAIQRSLDANTL